MQIFSKNVEMPLQVYLISTPWARANAPSIQIACLKSYLDKLFGERINTSTWSAFVEVPSNIPGNIFSNAASFSQYGEYLYFLAYIKRYVPSVRFSMSEQVRIINEKVDDGLKSEDIDVLEEATRKTVDNMNLTHEGLCLVGFTLNFNQLYASLYYLTYFRQRYPRLKPIVVFGGACAAHPLSLRIFKKLGIDAFCVIGEGELKLKKIVQLMLETGLDDLQSLHDAIRGCDQGVFHVSDNIDLSDRNDKLFQSQIQSMEDIPLPDYSEYFQLWKDLCDKDNTFLHLRRKLLVLAEGTRGCFAK